MHNSYQSTLAIMNLFTCDLNKFFLFDFGKAKEGRCVHIIVPLENVIG